MYAVIVEIPMLHTLWSFLFFLAVNTSDQDESDQQLSGLDKTSC